MTEMVKLLFDISKRVYKAIHFNAYSELHLFSCMDKDDDVYESASESLKKARPGHTVAAMAAQEFGILIIDNKITNPLFTQITNNDGEVEYWSFILSGESLHICLQRMDCLDASKGIDRLLLHSPKSIYGKNRVMSSGLIEDLLK